MKPEAYRVIVVVDTNDADFVTRSTDDATYEEVQNIIQPVAKALKKTNGKFNVSEHSNDPLPKELYEGVLTYDQINSFLDFCPYPEGGFHSINSIAIIPLPIEEEVLFCQSGWEL